MYFVREYKTIPLEHKVDVSSTAGAVKLSKKQILIDFFKTPSLVMSYLSFASQAFVYMSIIFFLPTFYMRVWGVSLQQATTMTSMPILILIFAGPVGGWLMDKWMLKNLTARMYFPGNNIRACCRPDGRILCAHEAGPAGLHCSADRVRHACHGRSRTDLRHAGSHPSRLSGP